VKVTFVKKNRKPKPAWHVSPVGLRTTHDSAQNNYSDYLIYPPDRLDVILNHGNLWGQGTFHSVGKLRPTVSKKSKVTITGLVGPLARSWSPVSIALSQTPAYAVGPRIRG